MMYTVPDRPPRHTARVIASDAPNPETVLRAERRSLHTYMFAMLAQAVAGFVVFALTQVSATQLDGAISLINAGVAFLAGRLAVASAQPPDATSPYGRLALENIYALFRSLMILGVVVVGVVANAVKVTAYLITRVGHEPHFVPAAIYAGCAASICFAMRWNHLRNNRSINGASGLLRLEAHACTMAGFISSGICISLALVAYLPEGTAITSDSFNVKAIADSLIVIVLCLILVRGPLHQIRLEFGRLSGKRSDPQLDLAVRAAIAAVSEEHHDKIDNELTLIDAFAISRGKTIEVDLRVSFTGTMTVQSQDEIRANTYRELRDRVGPLRLTLVFSDFPIHAIPQRTA
jgi:predicted Co/Zn/Cd cation transporter (cation efflux family)